MFIYLYCIEVNAMIELLSIKINFFDFVLYFTIYVSVADLVDKSQHLNSVTAYHQNNH
jgi:hypothetical protein